MLFIFLPSTYFSQVLDMPSNLDLNPRRLMPLEIFDCAFQTALQVKEFICTCEQFIVNYSYIHVPQYQP